MSKVEKPDLTAVFEHYGLRILADTGGWVKAVCPLPAHEDKNPSASVNADEGVWTCFVCNVTGDSFKIIMEREHVGFLAAVAFAKENFAGSGGTVRDSRRSSGLLPGGQGHRPGRRQSGPAWRLRRTGTGA